MSNSLLEPFYYSRNERKGILLFLLIILGLFIFQMVAPRIFHPYQDILTRLENLPNKPLKPEGSATNISLADTTEFEYELNNKPVLVQKKDDKAPITRSKQSFTKKSNFDPNTISIDSLRIYGVTAIAANNWDKYRKAGGKFFDEDDVLKIYGIDSIIYQRLAPYVSLSKRKKGGVSKGPEKQILLNQAEASELQKLRGIGPVLSERIIKFRDALGGFHELSQIKEVYGISDSLYQTIIPKLTIKANHKKININVLSEEQLARHPYIKWKKARLISRYKAQRDSFENVNQLYQIKAFDSSYVQKILPYLTI